MILLKTRSYKKSVSFLSKKDQSLLFHQEKLLSENIFNPKLHTKKLQGFPNSRVFSFRIMRVYRGIFRLNGKDIILFAIGHRKDIYKTLE